MCVPLPRYRAEDPCFVAPSPQLQERLQKEYTKARGKAKSLLAESLGLAPRPRAFGFEDGVIIPPDHFPPGMPSRTIRSAAAERAPLRGSVRVIVVLVDFSDKALTATQQHFEELFFSTGVLPNGSVKEFYKEATNGLVDITGSVVGTYRMPQKLSWYANENFGINRPPAPGGTTRARDLAHDAAVAADADVDFTPYDNDHNGFVDAFIVVHAGGGGEETGDPGDLWSHKWTLPHQLTSDATKIFAYLTIPEDAKVGVCAHELGHLLFGFPDLYDIDDTSEGVGSWCLMGAGSWNGGGDVPAHPSAWCKANQGWVSVTNVSSSGARTIPDVKSSHDVLRLWTGGQGGQEYFLVENRQRTGFDAQLPGEGLLIWHVDEAQPDNTNESHYRIGLVQADGKRDLELKQNRGDDGDPYPGASGNDGFSAQTTPSSKSFAGQDSGVSVTAISAAAGTMTANLAVQAGKGAQENLPLKRAEILKPRKEINKDILKDGLKDGIKDNIKDGIKDTKELNKDLKDGRKEIKDTKEVRKDIKENKEGRKDFKDDKDGIKDGAKDVNKDDAKDGIKDGFKDNKENQKDFKDDAKDGIKDGKELGKDGFKDNKEFEGPGNPGFPGELLQGSQGADPVLAALERLEARLGAVESALGSGSAQAFIGAPLRPDLHGAPQQGTPASTLEHRMQQGDAAGKREYDQVP